MFNKPWILCELQEIIAVHPGQIDVDNEETVSVLFELVNLIAEHLISMPKRIGKVYSSLPQSAIEGIENRDKEH